jgi:hypothetical protein
MVPLLHDVSECVAGVRRGLPLNPFVDGRELLPFARGLQPESDLLEKVERLRPRF